MHFNLVAVRILKVGEVKGFQNFCNYVGGWGGGGGGVKIGFGLVGQFFGGVEFRVFRVSNYKFYFMTLMTLTKTLSYTVIISWHLLFMCTLKDAVPLVIFQLCF